MKEFSLWALLDNLRDEGSSPPDTSGAPYCLGEEHVSLFKQAADAIERLSAENAELRKVIESGIHELTEVNYEFTEVGMKLMAAALGAWVIKAREVLSNTPPASDTSPDLRR